MTCEPFIDHVRILMSAYKYVYSGLVRTHTNVGQNRRLKEEEKARKAEEETKKVAATR